MPGAAWTEVHLQLMTAVCKGPPERNSEADGAAIEGKKGEEDVMEMASRQTYWKPAEETQ